MHIENFWHIILFWMMGFIGVTASLFLVAMLRERKKMNINAQPVCGTLTRIVDVEFLKWPVITRILERIAWALFAIAGAIFTARFTDISDILVGGYLIVSGVYAGLAVSLDIPKIRNKYRRFRFDFDSGVFIRYDYPRMRTDNRSNANTYADFSNIASVEDLKGKIRIRMKKFDFTTVHMSLTLRTRNLTMSHEEILDLLRQSVTSQ